MAGVLPPRHLCPSETAAASGCPRDRAPCFCGQAGWGFREPGHSHRPPSPSSPPWRCVVSLSLSRSCWHTDDSGAFSGVRRDFRDLLCQCRPQRTPFMGPPGAATGRHWECKEKADFPCLEGITASLRGWRPRKKNKQTKVSHKANRICLCSPAHSGLRSLGLASLLPCFLVLCATGQSQGAAQASVFTSLKWDTSCLFHRTGCSLRERHRKRRWIGSRTQ